MVQDFNKDGIPDYLQAPLKGYNPGMANQFGATTFMPSFLPIMLPDETATNQPSWSPQQAIDWFTYVAPQGKSGGAKKTYYNDVTGLMTRLGIPKNKWNDAWKDAVQWTQTPGSGSQGDPRDYFMGYVDTSKYATGGRKYGKTKSKTIQTTEYSPSTAAGDINRVIEQEIGRTATAAEVADYRAGVNAQAALSPAISTTTTDTQPGKGGILETSTSTVKQTTGFDPTIFAQNFARSRPDYAESFATKAVLGIIQKVLRDPNAIGQVVE